jgi:serine phosphatase RsbU (regulator of sigma subunit)
MLTAEQPFGATADASWSTQELALRPGDRLLFLTDGMLERGAESLDMPALLSASAHLHPREAIQTITHAVLDAAGGVLEDDATSLCLDWHGGAPGDRVAHAGAEQRARRARQ